MPCCNNHNSFYQSVGKFFSFLIAFLSVIVIITSLFCKEKRISQERLRCIYDGLSPKDYQ